MDFIDTHAHIDGEEFDLDRDEMVARAREAGAEAILVPAINMEGLDKLRAVVKKYPGFAYAMIGLHPEDVRSNWREVVSEMRHIQEASPTEFIAIGEVGLDFYWSREYEHEQMECFEEQVRWAIEARLPLMIHCRKAQNEMVGILKKYRDQLCGGVFHCFAGNEKEAAELLAFDGFLIGVGGVLTFKKSHLPEVLPSIPLDRLVCETDAPYMAPVPMRGKRNESAFIPYVIERMAEAYRTTADEVARRTTANARRLFTSLVMTMMLLLAPLTATANDNDYNNDGSILPCRGCYLQPKAANTRVGTSSSILAQPGKKKQLVILMQYPDKAFLDPDPQSYWHNALNTGKISNTNAIGSLHQYFLDQSNGIFDVDFDVRGPFTTKENRAYYGKDVNGNDQHADSLVIEGCLALDGEVDLNDYDWDGDGIVDQIIVIYAGNGQNDTSSTDRNETVWPHQWALSQYKPWKAHKQNGVII
ncbi:MAG: YchF/TatD family DNA exonuclease, partial [Prevotella sp.]|nr:YchF/TatD family DNA exonuclease [Prevotella sp.]